MQLGYVQIQAFHLLELHLKLECHSRLDIVSNYIFLSGCSTESSQIIVTSPLEIVRCFLACISRGSTGVLIQSDSDGTNKKSQKASEKETSRRNPVTRLI